MRVDGGVIVPWTAATREGTTITLTPAALIPGEYELITPTDSMFGGSTYQFFTVR